MKTLRTVVVMSGLVWFFVGCSTLHKRAKNQVEGGAYEEAIGTYQAILSKDPNDTDAQVGLKSAQQKFMDKRLLEIRNARLAGSDWQAIELLSDLLAKESAWGISPGGAANYTQTEEVDYGVRILQTKVRQNLSRGLAMKAAFDLRRLAPLENAMPALMRESLNRDVQKSGSTLCRSLLQKLPSGNPYQGEFVHKVCRFWNQPSKGAQKSSENISAGLWSEVDLTSQVNGLGENEKAVVESALQDGLKHSAWYDARSKQDLKIKASGAWVFDVTQETVPMFHNYTTQEPYTAYETVTRTRRVPRTLTYYDALTRTNRTTTTYNDEQYQETVPVTRYRDVPHVFNFTGRRYTQHIKLSLIGKAMLGAKELPIHMDREANESDTEHDVRMPHIGLQPKALQLSSRQQWLSTLSAQIGKEFEEKLIAHWKELYCNPDSHFVKKHGEEESVFRCLKQTSPTYPAYVAQWFPSNLGLTLAETNQLLGITPKAE